MFYAAVARDRRNQNLLAERRGSETKKRRRTNKQRRPSDEQQVPRRSSSAAAAAKNNGAGGRAGGGGPSRHNIMSLMTESLLLHAQSLRAGGEMDSSIDALRVVLSQCAPDIVGRPLPTDHYRGGGGKGGSSSRAFRPTPSACAGRRPTRSRPCCCRGPAG